MTLYSKLAVDLRHAEPAPSYVEADLDFLVPMSERPYHYTFEPPPGEVRTNAVYAPHRVPVYDARPFAPGLSLDREGFALIDSASAVSDFYDEEELRRVYYPEAERLVADATGAARVVIFDHTIRRRVPGLEDRTKAGPRQPALRVHNDYTVRSGPQRVRDLLGTDADALLRRRFAIVNVWRPIKGPLRDAPLAVCDAGSVAFTDLVASDQLYPDRQGEIYLVAHNPAQRWFYAPAMQRDEALLLKCYDSLQDGTARFAPHGAFEDPTAPDDVLPRESIEIRTLVFYPD
jgi:hypothetical protein